MDFQSNMYVVAVFIFDASKFQCFIEDSSAPCSSCATFFYIISNNFHFEIYALETWDICFAAKLIMFGYFTPDSLSFSNASIKFKIEIKQKVKQNEMQIERAADNAIDRRHKSIIQ